MKRPDTPSSYPLPDSGALTLKTVYMMPKEGSAFPDRTCCCVFTTSNGFTRKDASAPAVAPQMKLLAGRGRSVFFTTERVCSRLRFTLGRERHISQWRAEKEMSRRRFV